MYQNKIAQQQHYLFNYLLNNSFFFFTYNSSACDPTIIGARNGTAVGDFKFQPSLLVLLLSLVLRSLFFFFNHYGAVICSSLSPTLSNNNNRVAWAVQPLLVASEGKGLSEFKSNRNKQKQKKKTKKGSMKRHDRLPPKKRYIILENVYLSKSALFFCLLITFFTNLSE